MKNEKDESMKKAVVLLSGGVDSKQMESIGRIVGRHAVAHDLEFDE